MVGITNDMNPWIRVPLRIIAVLPVYQVMLLVIGSLFGQFRFFLNLQKKWWRIK
jgi:ferrochelatase